MSRSTDSRHGKTITRDFPRSIKVAVDFPVALYQKTEAAVRELGTNRSELIRIALERYISQMEEKKLEASLIAGYVENAALAREGAEILMGAETELS